MDAQIIGCPIASTMGVVGKKWGMPIMRDAVMMGRTRFRDFLHGNPGLTPRVLSRRLHELCEAGYLVKVGTDERPQYTPSPQGQALAPVLQAVAEFGLRYHADQVFADGQPRPLAAFVSQ